MKMSLRACGILVLVFLFLLSMAGCSGSKGNALVGVWTVESSVTDAKEDFLQESYLVIAKMHYYEGATVEITEDSKFIVNGNIGTYEVLDDSQIEIKSAAASGKDAYILDNDHLTLKLFDGQIVVNMIKK
ncbi:MAG: hypothetical protein IJA08_00250 [Clostridia bacterium]|nr:hypothetical protein [Clostridia bacterium]